jgi:hypothetical protein
VKADLEIGAPVSPFNPARPFYPHYHRCSEITGCRLPAAVIDRRYKQTDSGSPLGERDQPAQRASLLLF